VMVGFTGCNRLTCKTIHEAAAKGDLADVKRHLQKGADVNIKVDNDWTPLIYSVFNGKQDVVVFLISIGADVNVASRITGWTPLHVAADKGYLEVVETLVSAGANVNAKDTVGMTPINSAVGDGHKDVIEFLKQHGASGEDL
ncbi:MAG: ankyrin repeat domain-containing protein, partial [Candidatus Gracilibacteria bacterium]|nr:ankyrin repeat domain-containing protein [Candidatus Gracilibacteria bacterium]